MFLSLTFKIVLICNHCPSQIVVYFYGFKNRKINKTENVDFHQNLNDYKKINTILTVKNL